MINGINLDWDLPRNRLFALAIIPALIAAPLFLTDHGALAGIGLRTIVLLVAWRWTRLQPSGIVPTTKSPLSGGRAATSPDQA